MRHGKIGIRLMGLLAAGMAVPATAHAGMFEKVLLGLSEAGFNFVAEENFLSGGSDLIVTRTFNGETLDFGATELSLQGSPTFTFTTGGRGIDLLEVSVNTGGTPFNYLLTTDTGNQITTLNGSFLLDASAKFNEFGYYDMTFNVSSRQSYTNDGRFSNDPLTQDFDVGPINLRGNIFADLLAVVTDPLFQALGVDNIFAQFSISGQFESQVSAKIAALQAKARSGQVLTAEELAELGSAVSLAAAFGLEPPDLSFLGDLDLPGGSLHDDPLALVARQSIPEPATGLLLVLGIPFLLRRQR